MRESADIYNHMRQKDILAFKSAAEFYGAYILVRRTNSTALSYIGVLGFSPKRLDCKFKTADFDFYHQGIGRQLSIAGLVVNPLMDQEFSKAFKPLKFQSTTALWQKYHRDFVTPRFSHDENGDPNFVYMPRGKLYTVDSRPDSDRYGCVMFSSSCLLSSASYIHADYDLYAIVPMHKPRDNVRVSEKRYGVDHARGQMFFDVQHYVNKRMEVAMVQHGSQEKYTEDLDDTIDVFFPDGRTVKCCDGVEDIRNLYNVHFKGRKMFSKSATCKTLLGDWVVTVT